MKLILDRLKRSSPPAIGDLGGGGEVIMPGSAAGKATIAVGEDQAGQMDRAIAFPVGQVRRIFHRARSQHGRIDEAKDRGIGSDAERHGNDGKRGKAGFPDELAKAEPNRQPRLTLSATKD